MPTSFLSRSFIPLRLRCFLLAIVCGAAGFIAYRDVKLSAELMLWIEVFSVSFILIVLAVLIFRFGFQFDLDQLRLKGASVSTLGPALVLSMFSFVGFEAPPPWAVKRASRLRPSLALYCNAQFSPACSS